MSGRGANNNSGGGGGRGRGGGRSGSGGRGRGGSKGGKGKPQSSSQKASTNNTSQSNNTGRGGSGGGGRGSSRRNRRDRGGGKGATEAKKKKEEEAKVAAEKAAIKAKQIEAEKQRQEEIDRRSTLQSNYNISINSAISTLENYTTNASIHEKLRHELSDKVPPGESKSPLTTKRTNFESSKKKLKSDLKKCTAFVKKIKAGQYGTPKEIMDLPNGPIKTLNLTRYVEEVAGALLDPTTKVKGSGMSFYFVIVLLYS